MKKLFVLLLAASLWLSMSACEAEKPTSSSPANGGILNKNEFSPNYSEPNIGGSAVNIVESETLSDEELEKRDKEMRESSDQWLKTKEIMKRPKKQPTKTYSEKEIISSISYLQSYNFMTMMYQLDERYPIEYLAIQEGSSPYCVYRLEEGGKLFVFFNSDERALHFVTHIFVVKEPLTKKDFDGIKKGMSLADVQAVDSGVELINSIKPFSLRCKYTLHLVEEGVIKVTYSGGDYDVMTNTYKNTDSFMVESVEFIPNGDAVFYYGNTFPYNYNVLDGDYPTTPNS